MFSLLNFIRWPADKKCPHAFCIMKIKDRSYFLSGTPQQDLYYCILLVQINSHNNAGQVLAPGSYRTKHQSQRYPL